MNPSNADLLTVLINIGVFIPTLIMMLQSIAVLIGVYLVGTALIEMWGASNDNASKFLAGKTRYSVGNALIQLFVGAIILACGTLEWMGVMSRTLTSDYANSRMMSYSASGTTLAEQSQLALLALLGIMQVVGLVAMIKGWMTFNAHFNQTARASMGQAWGWMIGGVLAWNFKWFADALNNTLGFNLIGLFSV